MTISDSVQSSFRYVAYAFSKGLRYQVLNPKDSIQIIFFTLRDCREGDDSKGWILAYVPIQKVEIIHKFLFI